MNKRHGSFWILAILALVFSGTAFAAQTAAPKKATAAKKAPAVHEMSSSGVITSIDATHLMMTHKVAGKDQPMTLVLTPETKRMGPLAAGNKVAVKYHAENSDQVATMVTGTAVTAKAKSPAAPKKS